MYCRNCGSNIDDRAVVCPNCGVPTQDLNLKTPSAQAQEKTNSLAIVGFVLSFFVALAGLICSIVARKQISETGEKGGGLALAGMIISIISIIMAFLLVVIYVIAIIGVMGGMQ